MLIIYTALLLLPKAGGFTVLVYSHYSYYYYYSYYDYYDYRCYNTAVFQQLVAVRPFPCSFDVCMRIVLLSHTAEPDLIVTV